MHFTSDNFVASDFIASIPKIVARKNETKITTGLTMRTRMNKHNLKQFGPDSQFADSEFQYELMPEEGGWCVVPNAHAKNETLLNGHCLNDKATLSSDDKISIGREATGVSKLELRVQV